MPNTRSSSASRRRWPSSPSTPPVEGIMTRSRAMAAPSLCPRPAIEKPRPHRHPPREIVTRARAKKIAQEHAQAQRNGRKMWLDQLPVELCERIANYVTREGVVDGLAEEDYDSYQCTAALNLAETSPLQRAAVLDALDFDYEPPTKLLRGDQKRWFNIFLNKLEAIKIGNTLAFATRRILMSPSLRAASVPNNPVILRAISKSPKLRKLSVTFSKETPVKPLFATLKQLDIVDLHLQCEDKGVCVFKDVFPTKQAARGIAALCPNLYSLVLICDCADSEPNFDPIIGVFPKLHYLSINRPVSESTSTISYLQSLESVTLNGSHWMKTPTLFKLATTIGKSVSSICVENADTSLPPFHMVDSSPPAGDPQMLSLYRCPRLTCLEVILAPRADMRMPVLRDLEDVTVVYDWVVNGRAEELGQHIVIELEMYSPPRGFWSGIASRNRNLSELSLFNCRLSRNEVEEILRRTGPKLEIFGTSLQGQDEAPPDRLLDILECMRKYNPIIRELEVGEHSLFADQNQGLFTESEIVRLEHRIRRAIRLVHRQSSVFDVQTLCDSIEIPYNR